MLKRELEEHAHELHIELDEANERLLRIWDLHTKADDSEYCQNCLYSYPCPTVQAFFLCECCEVSSND
jgi:hypothetical protein